MLTSDGRYQLLFSGEIYNFKELKKQLGKEGFEFRTECDSEVILMGYAAWGKRIVSRLQQPI